MKNFFKKDELKLLWPFYGNHFIAGIFILYPAFYIIHLINLDFSLTQIGIIISTIALAMLIFEVPTGAIADIFGRKFSTLLGNIVMIVILVGMFFAKDFYSYLILFFFFGISLTLLTGAQIAWTVDLLKFKRKNKLIDEYFIKRQSFINASLFLSGIVGALIVKYFGLPIIFLITAFGIFLGLIFFLFGQEHFVREKMKIKDHFTNLFSTTKEAIIYSSKHKVISYLMIITFISTIAITFTSQLTWQPFFLEKGFQEHWFGYLFSGAMVLGIFVPYITKPLLKLSKKYKYYLLGVALFMALLLFSVKLFSSLIALIAIFMFYITGYDFKQPVWNSFFQKHTKSKIRATVTSLYSMIGAFVAIIFAPIAGMLADKFGPGNVIFIAGFIMLPTIYFYAKIKE